MRQPTLMQQSQVKVAEVIVRGRLRPVSDAGVESLIASITETGVMKDAIHVRKKKDGGLHLIAGGHRLEAARRLGWEEIEAKVWTDVTDDWARLMEIDDNLAGAEMNALDTAVFLATRKAVYERMHPETRANAFRGNQYTGKVAADIMSVATFAASTAEKFGLTDRHVRRMIAAGSKLMPDQVSALREAPRPVTLKDLGDIARITQPADRYSVVELLAAGRAKSAADALRSIRVERGLQSPPKSDEDQKLLALMSAWSRAGKAVRRKFVAEHFEELGLLGAEEEEARFEAEKPVLLADLAAGKAAS